MNQYAMFLMYLGAGLVIVLGSLSALTAKRSYRFQPGRIEGVIGKLGSGKSMFAVAKVLLPAADALRKGKRLGTFTGRPWRRIITNFAFDPGPGFEGVELQVVEPTSYESIWDQLEAMAETDDDGDRWLDALIVIDEAHLFVPSDKQKMGDKARWFCSMLRKLNCELWWISQSEMKVHKRLRSDTQLIWRVSRKSGLSTILFGPSSTFQALAYEPEKLNLINQRAEDRRFYRMSRRVLRAYNSFQLIVPDGTRDVSRSASTLRPVPSIRPAIAPPGYRLTNDDPATPDNSEPGVTGSISDDESSTVAI